MAGGNQLGLSELIQNHLVKINPVIRAGFESRLSTTNLVLNLCQCFVLYFRRSEQPPKYKSDSSLSRDSDRDSLDDYGEGKFNEDGSFIQEYGDDKTETQGERDQSALSTFV